MRRRDYVEVYRDRGGDWRSRFVRSSGQIMATGAEGYEGVQHCAEGAQHVYGLPRRARLVSQWKRQHDGSYRWYR